MNHAHFLNMRGIDHPIEFVLASHSCVENHAVNTTPLCKAHECNFYHIMLKVAFIPMLPFTLIMADLL